MAQTPPFWYLARRPQGDSDNDNAEVWRITSGDLSEAVTGDDYEVGHAIYDQANTVWSYSWDWTPAHSVDISVLDAVPDAFAFTDQTGASLGGLVWSAPITVSGINTPAEISVSGGQYRVQDGEPTSDEGLVENGEVVQVAVVASESYLSDASATLTIGGVSGTFTATTTSEPLAYWTGANALTSGAAYTTPTTSRVIFAQFSWPETEAHEQVVVAQFDGRARISIRSTGELRVEQSMTSLQIQHTQSIGAQPGDIVSVLTQIERDGTARPYVVVQVNDGTPTLLASKTAPSGDTFITGGDFYVGRFLTSSSGQFYKGVIGRAVVYHDCPVFDTYTLSEMRNFVDADGALEARSVSDAIYGTPVYEAPVTVSAANAGTNTGSREDFSATGTFAAGIASDWFDLSAQDFASDAATGATVATIETNADPLPQYTLTSDPGGEFAIEGNALKRSATAISYDGQYRPITIRETQQNGIVREREFSLWPGQIGEDTLLGRAQISASRTACYQGEHVHFEVSGLYAYEKAMLGVEFDFGDASEVYSNTRPSFIWGTSARIKRGSEVMHTFTGSTGVRTVTVKIYRAGTATPVWTDTIDITVADPATVLNVHVVARDGVFTGAPSGTQYTAIPTAIAAAQAQIAAGQDAIVYLKRGEDWQASVQNSSASMSAAGDASMLIRAWGSGANPKVQFRPGQDGWVVQGGTSAGYSLSVVGIDFYSEFDAFNVLSPSNSETWEKSKSSISAIVQYGHYTIGQCTAKGRMAFVSESATDRDDAHSACLHDVIGDEFEPYAYYFGGYSRKCGVDGGRFVKASGQPNISKIQMAAEQPGLDVVSINGPGRVAEASSAILQRQQAAGFHGWSDGDTASQLEATYDPMLLSSHQPVCRMASSKLLGDRTISISENEFENGLQLTAVFRSWGEIVVARNYFVAHAGASSLLDAHHRGLWCVSNVFVLANVLSEQGGALRFLGLASPAESLDDAAGRHYRQRIVGNTFIDLRSADKLQPAESGSIESMFAGLSESYVECRDNIVYVPNRVVSDPGIPGLTVISNEALSTAEIMETNYPGLIAPGPGEFNYAAISALTVDSDYATPSGTGIEGKLPTGSTYATAWSGAGPAFDLAGALVTGPRPPGAWKDLA